MLILAGVSLNALMGENGIIKQATYANFLSDMQEVQEKFEVWRITNGDANNDYESNEIPVLRLVTQQEINSAERLVGEIGFYRRWSISKTKPIDSIKLNSTNFNERFESEIVRFPAGVQDLYVLDNEQLGINQDKKYYIDAVNSIIYSSIGFDCNGIKGYSLGMVKALVSGSDEKMPNFVETEINGFNGGQLAGNISTKYLMDSNGNYIDKEGNIVEEKYKVLNPDYNEFGFSIIGDATNVNVYKLYNNGDLYAKGIKGYILNSDKNDMEGLDESKYCPINIPEYIPGVNTNEFKLIVGMNTFFVIDKNKELWAWGKNDNNILGLSDEEKIFYSGYEAKKIIFENCTVEKVFCGSEQFVSSSVFVLVKDSNDNFELYASGKNSCGQLGTGEIKSETDSFKKVNFNNPQNIINICCGYDGTILVLTEEEDKNIVYYAGCSKWSIFEEKSIYNQNCSTFINLNDYTELFSNVNITKIYPQRNLGYFCVIDNKLYLFNGSSLVLQNFGNPNATLEYFSSAGYVSVAKIKVENEFQIWYLTYAGLIDYYGLGGNDLVVQKNWARLDTYFPSGITGKDIKSFYVGCDRIGSTRYNIIYLTNDGLIFGSGKKWALGIGTTSDLEKTNGFEVIDYLPSIDKMEWYEYCVWGLRSGTMPLKGSDGKYYMTGFGELEFNEKILQSSWKLIAQNVKKFKASTNASKNALAYIDFNNDLWVLGECGLNIGLNDNKNYRTFVRLKDYYDVNSEIFSKINGCIDDYGISYTSIFFKTNQKDNNTVYVAGVEWYSENDNITFNQPTLVKNNVKIMNIGIFAKNFLTNDGKWYKMGCDLDIDSTNEAVLFESDIDDILLFHDGIYNQFVLAGGKVYSKSVHNASGHDPNSNVFSLIEPSVFGNENIISIAGAREATIFLTESGKLYGFGKLSKLGIGHMNESDESKTPILIDSIDNVASIVPCFGYTGNTTCLFIVIKKDGTVWGTGSNKNGILGRWKGGDRFSMSAKYQTAFVWVECPELEI